MENVPNEFLEASHRCIESIKALGFKPSTKLNLFCEGCGAGIKVISGSIVTDEIGQFLNKHRDHPCFFGFSDGRRWRIPNDGGNGLQQTELTSQPTTPEGPLSIPNPDNRNDLPLHPDHLQDLRGSGLSDETIKQAGIYSVPPRDINKRLGFNDSRIESVMVFPYPGCDGFEIYKVFPPRDGLKYVQPKGSMNRLYIPHLVRGILSNSSILICFTEGVKKAIKSTQDGIPCVAMNGLWNWSDGSKEKKLIPDFDWVVLGNRTVYLIPDNDWLQPDHHGEPKNLRQAVYELGYRLIDRGAKVFIIELPPGSVKGLDDYLCQHSVEEFKALPKKEIRKQTIPEMIADASLDNLREILKRLSGLPETERAIHINALSKKLNIAKGDIKKELQTLSAKKKEAPDIDRLLESGANPESHYSAQNFIDGILSFGAILGKEKVLVRSDGQIILADGSKGDFFRFKRSTLTGEVIKRFRAGEDVHGGDLLGRIKNLFVDHVIFPNPRIPTLLGVWVLGTYFFKAFQYYGYLWVNSPVKRCGKSLLLDILSLLCFNATLRLVDPSPSFLFREVDRNDGTLILDEIESLGGADKEQKSELISLLNAGFQRGSQAPRMESRNREFEVVYFNAYSPKAMAGIKNIVDTLEDRSFKVGMARKKKSEAVKRFNLRSLNSHIEKIREDCFIWALRYAEDVVEVYGHESDSKFPGTESLDDRLKDILEPLLSIASIIDAQDDKPAQITKNLIELVRDMGRGRDDQEALSGAIPATVNVLKDMIDGIDERFVSADDLFSKFQADEDLNFIQSKRGLAFFLAKLNLNRIQKRELGRIVRGYEIRRTWLEDLEKRYV